MEFCYHIVLIRVCFFYPRILNLALSHIVNDILLRGDLTITAKDNFKAILNNYNTIWLEFSEEKRKKEAEEDSMYKFKSRLHCMDSDDTERSEKQYKELFPSFGREFNDLIPKDALNDDDDDDDDDDEEGVEQDMTSMPPHDDKSHDMSYVDMNEIYNAMQTVIDNQSGLTDAKLVTVFLQGYREVISLSTLNSLRSGGYQVAFELQLSINIITYEFAHSPKEEGSMKQRAQGCNGCPINYFYPLYN